MINYSDCIETVTLAVSPNHRVAGAVVRDPPVFGHAAHPLAHHLLGGAAYEEAGDGGPHHPAIELLHQAEGGSQAGAVHRGPAGGGTRRVQPPLRRRDRAQGVPRGRLPRARPAGESASSAMPSVRAQSVTQT
eukprot:369870-Prorocentrum_minimum.AAC.1